jgi:hypothetical protein
VGVRGEGKIFIFVVPNVFPSSSPKVPIRFPRCSLMFPITFHFIPYCLAMVQNSHGYRL